MRTSIKLIKYPYECTMANITAKINEIIDVVNRSVFHTNHAHECKFYQDICAYIQTHDNGAHDAYVNVNNAICDPLEYPTRVEDIDMYLADVNGVVKLSDNILYQLSTQAYLETIGAIKTYD